MADDPENPDFSGARLKVQRAKSHIADFETEAGRFFSKHPHQVSFQPYRKGQRHGYAVYERIHFPAERLALLVGDAVHNLRSALDHLIAACAIANGRSVNDTQFPITNFASELPDRLKMKVRKAGPLAQRLVRKAKPYHRGNRALRAIHDLDLTDKHRLVIPIASTISVDITTGAWDSLPAIKLTSLIISGEPKGKFVAVPEGYERALHDEAGFTADVVFAREAPYSGQPCAETLLLFSEAVLDVIRAFELGFGQQPISDLLRQPVQHLVPVTSSI